MDNDCSDNRWSGFSSLGSFLEAHYYSSNWHNEKVIKGFDVSENEDEVIVELEYNGRKITTKILIDENVTADMICETISVLADKAKLKNDSGYEIVDLTADSINCDTTLEEKQKSYRQTYNYRKKRDFIVDIDTDNLIDITACFDDIAEQTSLDFGVGNNLDGRLSCYVEKCNNDVNNKIRSLSEDSTLISSKINTLLSLYHNTEVMLDDSELDELLEMDDPMDVQYSYVYYAGEYDSVFDTIDDFKSFSEYTEEYSHLYDSSLTADVYATADLLDTCVRSGYFGYADKLRSEGREDVAVKLEQHWPTFRDAFGKALYDKITTTPEILETTSLDGSKSSTVRLPDASIIQSAGLDTENPDYYDWSLSMLAIQDYPMSYFFSPAIGHDSNGYEYVDTKKGQVSNLYAELFYTSFQAVDEKIKDETGEDSRLSWWYASDFMEGRKPITPNVDVVSIPSYLESDPNVVYVDENFYFLKDETCSNDFFSFGLTGFYDEFNEIDTGDGNSYAYIDRNNNKLLPLGCIYQMYYFPGEYDSFSSTEVPSMEQIHADLVELSNSKEMDMSKLGETFDNLQYYSDLILGNEDFADTFLGSYANIYNGTFEVFRNRLFNEDSDYYLPPPEFQKFDSIESANSAVNRHLEEYFEKCSALVDVPFGMVLRNIGVGLVVGAISFVDSMIDTALSAVELITLLPSVVTGNADEVNKIARSYSGLLAMDFSDLARCMYNGGDVGNGAFWANIAEDLGYVVVGALIGNYAIGPTNFGRNIICAIGSFGKQSSKVAEEALLDMGPDGRIKPEYLYKQYLTSAYAAGSYMLRYCVNWGVPNNVHLFGKSFTASGEELALRVSLPYADEYVYSFGDDYNFKSAFASSCAGFASWTVKTVLTGSSDKANLDKATDGASKLDAGNSASEISAQNSMADSSAAATRGEAVAFRETWGGDALMYEISNTGGEATKEFVEDTLHVSLHGGDVIMRAFDDAA